MRAGVAASICVSVGLVFGLSGCGGGKVDSRLVTPIPAKGKVTYKGQPITEGEILFDPEFGPAARGKIGADGSFVLTTKTEGDGAVPMTHRVAVTVPGKKIPRKYQSVDSSQKQVDVVEGTSEYNVDFK